MTIEKESKTSPRKVIDKNKKKQRIVYFYVHTFLYFCNYVFTYMFIWISEENKLKTCRQDGGWGWGGGAHPAITVTQDVKY
jgi:hypothetical protein